MSSPSPSIHVNGEPRAVAPGCTVEQLLGELELGGHKVAVALNRSVVPRSRYAATPVDAGDRVEILEAVGGG